MSWKIKIFINQVMKSQKIKKNMTEKIKKITKIYKINCIKAFQKKVNLVRLNTLSNLIVR